MAIDMTTTPLLLSVATYICATVLGTMCLYLCCLVAQSSMDCSPPGSSVYGDSPGKNTEVGCHALFQGIFPTQESNPGLPHCRQILNRLSHQGSLMHVFTLIYLSHLNGCYICLNVGTICPLS